MPRAIFNLPTFFYDNHPVHVDYGIVWASNDEIHSRLPKGLQVELAWASTVAPGMQGCSNLKKGTVTNNQAKYTKDVLKRFNMPEVKLSFQVSALNE